MNLLIRNGRIVDPVATIDVVQDLLVVDGRIARLDRSLPPPADVQVIDATGKIVCPGFIDIHVHLREPGFEYKETIATGTRAAAAGGFTAVCCMANTSPVNDNRAVTDYILHRVRGEGVVRVYPIGAVTRNLEGTELADMMEQVEAGCVAFSDDGKCVMNAHLYRRAMEQSLLLGTRVISHAEDCHLSRGGVMNEGRVSGELKLLGQTVAAEQVMVARDIVLAELTGAHLHIAHVSTAGAVRMIREAKERGVHVTAEVTPHHLLLTDESIRSLDPNTKMAPPLRTEHDVEAVMVGLADGTIDCIATDHAPHAPTEKREFAEAANGIVGLETAVPLLLDRLVRPSILDLATFVTRLSAAPARLMNLPGGSLAPGANADITVLDLKQPWTVEPAKFRSRARNTPFAGWTGTGAPVMTIVGGKVVSP